MAMASANAIPKSSGTNNLSPLSGFRPMLSMALLAILPIAKAGKKPPTAIVNALAMVLATSGFIVFPLLLFGRQLLFDLFNVPYWVKLIIDQSFKSYTF